MTRACAAPDGYVAHGTDCDAANAAANPGAAELAGNDIDEDCDGHVASAQVAPPACGCSAAGGGGSILAVVFALTARSSVRGSSDSSWACRPHRFEDRC